MTAYGAAVSLQNTIDYICHSSHFSLVEPSLHIIQLAYEELLPLQEILQRLDDTSKSRSRKKVNALDGRIKEILWEFEDLLEFLLTDQILSQLQSPPPEQVDGDGGMEERVWEFQSSLLESLPSPTIINQSHASQSRRGGSGGKRDVFLIFIDLRPLQDDVRSLIHAVKYTQREYISELMNMPEDDEAISSIIGFPGTESKMIGLSDQFQRLKSHFMNLKYKFNPLVGMAGVGKTTLAMQIFQDPEIMSHFEQRRAWVTVGRKPQPVSQLLRGIQAQLCGDEKVGGSLEELLEGKRCLVVLDDVWEIEVFHSLIDSLTNIRNTSTQILVTARQLDTIIGFSCCTQVRFLNEEESKELLCEKVFGDKEICPPQLLKAATKIAKRCEGLPLLIVTVADILSNSRNTDPDFWNDVAEERNSVFEDAYNQISKVLYPSYDYLPQYLKMPFLFMGVFPQDYETPSSKIINMLTAEGWFHNTNRTQYMEEFVWKCLSELCFDKSLVLYNAKSIFWFSTSRCMYKNCHLHCAWRHVCRGEARKNKFYHVLKKLHDAEEEEVLKGQRGLCLQNNILFGIKEFCNSLRLNCASSTRSLYFFGPYHQYQIPIDVGFTLLRELDALKQRFYSFPTEILTLVHLKYLALTCNGEIPTTISKLFNLGVLIIHPHIKIRCCRVPSYVPIQIWDMQELEHIEILGKSLRAPNRYATLERLLTLVGVNASIGTILEVSRRIPNIRKLGVQIELMPYEDHNDLLSFFCCISTLESLKTLKCSIINPVIKYVYATTSTLMLPRGLKKLHLSGMGFPWEYMDVIGSLPNLQVLKLRSYAFRGPTWEAQEGSFSRLQFLLIEDTDLVQWKPRSGSFGILSYLSLKHCYKLKEMSWPTFTERRIECFYMLGYLSLKYCNKLKEICWPRRAENVCIQIELVDCNPLAFTYAKQCILNPCTDFHVTASSSFDKKPITFEFSRVFRGE